MEKDKATAKNMEYMKDEYTWPDLLAIVNKLRAPDGCPWDRAQTHESMKSCLKEECFEVIEAIDNHDIINMKEELGDVMLQVLLHSEIAQEDDEFSLDEVIDELAKKLVRRHPHVFGEGEIAKDVKDGLSKWDSVKLQEKADKKAELEKLVLEGKADAELLYREESQNALQKIPKAFPAILRAQKVYNKARKEFGVKSEPEITLQNIKMIIGQIEVTQMKNSDESNDLDLIGNALFEMVKLSEEMGENAEYSLTKATEEYINKVVR